jgi:hypothetical protein
MGGSDIIAGFVAVVNSIDSDNIKIIPVLHVRKGNHEDK